MAKNARRFGFDSLEDRLFLAGNALGIENAPGGGKVATALISTDVTCGLISNDVTCGLISTDVTCGVAAAAK